MSTATLPDRQYLLLHDVRWDDFRRFERMADDRHGCLHHSVRALRAIVIVAALSILSGCVDPAGIGKKVPVGSGGGTLRKDLRALAMAYHDYLDAQRKAPTDWQALIAASPKYTAALTRLRDDGVTVKWGTRLQDAREGTVNFVLAETPNGGPKLMLDGAIRD